ncbi:peptide-N(4)-(N-acetyl-beta-glucosaminyl)asparagine amidase-like [Sitodiplosis mosellana]|uniref:peptide-N(4)-(N-acetyl-beta- glucosaminyl)asparagine amidase-like n=1 Tax=Sitodiplosis mosellana TaxID=263140 RepID=UPI002443D31A|nr:peptide-N(4)-(N-acetyl-beta-glucosaminyl)asparagine amidase-like [Sitodiplosis mosellana]
MSVRVIEDDEHFQKELQAAGIRLVLVEFAANWSGPCKRIAKEFEYLPNKYSQVNFLKIDVQECQEASAIENISVIPTFLFYRNKTKIDILEGNDLASLEAKIQQLLNQSDENEQKFASAIKSLNSFYASDEANSSGDLVTPTFTPDELGKELKLDRNTVEFLKNEPVDERDPLMILDFQAGFSKLANFIGNKNMVFDALVRSGAQQISGNVFKFLTWEDLYASHSFMKNEIPWAFYSEYPAFSARNGLSNVPTIQTTIITWFSEQKLSTHPFEFFKF